MAFSTASLISGTRKIGFYRSSDEDSIGIHFLGANRESLIWTAVNYRDHANYIWSELPEYKKNYSIKLKKDGTFIIHKKDSIDNNITIKGSYWHNSFNSLYLFGDDYQGYHVEPRSTGPGTFPEIWVKEGGSFSGYICVPNQ